jgi:hypothetical protein
VLIELVHDRPLDEDSVTPSSRKNNYYVGIPETIKGETYQNYTFLREYIEISTENVGMTEQSLMSTENASTTKQSLRQIFADF